jgi:hypothetical protein
VTYFRAIALVSLLNAVSTQLGAPTGFSLAGEDRPDRSQLGRTDSGKQRKSEPSSSIDLKNGAELTDLTLLPAGQARLDLLEGYLEWRADRELTDQQRVRIQKLADILARPRQQSLTREIGEQARAAREMGEWGHVAAIDPLARTLRDKAKHYLIRHACVSALCRIADKRVVEPLIEAIADVDIGYIPEGGLRKITRTKWGGWEDLAEQQRDPMPNPDTEPAGYKAWLLCRQERWRQWWKDNGAKVELDRSAAFEPPAGPY